MEVIESSEIIDFDKLIVPNPTSCDVPGCDKPHHLMGLCWYHFTFQD